MVASVPPANTTRLRTRAVTAPTSTEATIPRPADRRHGVASAEGRGLVWGWVAECVWTVMRVSIPAGWGTYVERGTRSGVLAPLS
jgi:hypothetical protein